MASTDSDLEACTRAQERKVFLKRKVEKGDPSMCGILVVLKKSNGLVENRNYEKFLESVARRGPHGNSFLQEDCVWMGHTLLAIIDLTKNAVQPFSLNDKNLVLTFNGEIYSFRELRNDLERLGYNFRFESDTEVILALYEQYGVDGFSQLRGMYAFVLYDNVKKTIVIAIDRFDEKPLYVTNTPNRMILSSQLLTNKAIAGNTQ
jgi:asparagine synthase (glutamine-hydrolysing)